MKFFRRSNTDKNSSSSKEFKKYIDEQMNYLEFSPTTQKGLLFFLGASFVAEINDTPFDLGLDKNDESKFSNFLLEVINLYSVSTGDFSDYGDLNDYVFSNAIYNFSYIIHSEILDIDTDIDENLRKIELKNNVVITPSKTTLDQNLIEKYKSQKLSLNTFQNLISDFFDIIGGHLE